MIYAQWLILLWNVFTCGYGAAKDIAKDKPDHAVIGVIVYAGIMWLFYVAGAFSLIFGGGK